MKRLMLSAIAICTFAAVTFAQANPAPKEKTKAKTETTKKEAKDSTTKKATPAKKSEKPKKS